jgi:hypothetical protein
VAPAIADFPGHALSMPSLFRFLFTVGTAITLVSVTLYVLAVRFEPPTREVVKVVPGVKIRKQ